MLDDDMEEEGVDEPLTGECVFETLEYCILT